MCVGYIDFGNSEEVSLNQLRPISMDLIALATQAIPCALAGKAKSFQLLGLSGGAHCHFECEVLFRARKSVVL